MLKKAWNDPVWSKVIAAAIIYGFGVAATYLRSAISPWLALVACLIGGIIILAVGLLIDFHLNKKKQEHTVNKNEDKNPPISVSGGSPVISINQTGGITAGTVNIHGPQRAQFTQEIANQILAGMPDKSKKVVLQTVGNQADQDIGNYVQQFLSNNGYAIERAIIGVMAPPPDRPFGLSQDSNQYTLTVSPSAH